jgi:signal transduction histidine kinase
MAAERRVRLPVGGVRFRVTAFAAVTVLVVLSGAGAVLAAVQRRTLTDNVEELLAGRTGELARAAAAGRLPGALPADEGVLSRVVTPGGKVLVAGPGFAGLGPPGRLGPGDHWATVRGLPADPAPFRVLSREVTLGRTGPVVVVQVAGALDDVQQSGAALLAGLAVTVPAATLVLAALVWLLVGRTLRPVEAIRAEVARIGTAAGAGLRVPEPRGGDEIGRLARTMNEMLGRIETAAERQRRFVADAAHELRSPLTRIRSELEVDLLHPATADPAATGRSVLAELAGLQCLVEDLLLLAKGDAGAAPGERAPVDLDDLVLAEAARLRAGGRVRVDIGAVGAARTAGDAGQLARVVRNLTDNAARYAHSSVTLGLAERGRSVVLTVADDGPGIPAGQRDRVFERFTRLDDARAAGTGGAGLGLAIARDIVRAHNGTITVDPRCPAGARLVVTLPAGP